MCPPEVERADNIFYHLFTRRPFETVSNRTICKKHHLKCKCGTISSWQATRPDTVEANIVGTRYLNPGYVDPEHLEKLIGFTRIDSKGVKSALHSYFVQGYSQADICRGSGISASQMSRKVSDIERVDRKVRDVLKFY
ncbi:PapB/FocB family fimbrial expression transcriptional regulator [Pseudomonas viridiflava]|uniref:PapB/FocB family fimbrial expression transcriptional regulator n=1 Tax=Pseudomonas viridiflava TaxID=33069 RepID=UPI000F0170D2